MSVSINFPQSQYATGAVALADTLAPGVAFRLLRVELHLSAAPTQETFTLTLDAGAGSAYDSVLYSRDMSAGTPADLIPEFGDGYEYASNDEIDAAWTNTDTRTYGLRWVYELLA